MLSRRGHAIIRGMSDQNAPPTSASGPAREAPRQATRAITPLTSALSTTPPGEPKVLCDRCGGEVYRMHAVWRCAACGFKSDCCGW